MVKSPTLYRYAANRQYSDIPDRVRSHPDDLYWTDRYGSTALHILCQATHIDRRLLRAVDAVLAAAPSLVEWPNVATWTPLHFAVEKRLSWGVDTHATALILRLIDACPNAVSLRTHVGFKTKTPFHIACEANTNIRVLRAMLEINPSLAIEPFVQSDIYSVTENPLQILWSQRTDLAEAKAKMALLLQASHTQSVHREFSVLNAACCTRCPREYFEHVLRDYYDQVFACDEDGLTPLYYAVQHAHVDSQSYTQFVVESLLKIYPSAGAISRHGRWPLHVAVGDAALTWHKGGVKELCSSYVNALRVADPRIGLVPFAAAALHAERSRLHLSTCYELLRSAPEMVYSGIQPITLLPLYRWEVFE